MTKQGVGARFGRRVSGLAVECGIVRVQLSIALSEVRLHCMCLALRGTIIYTCFFSFFFFNILQQVCYFCWNYVGFPWLSKSLKGRPLGLKRVGFLFGPYFSHGFFLKKKGNFSYNLILYHINYFPTHTKYDHTNYFPTHIKYDFAPKYYCINTKTIKKITFSSFHFPAPRKQKTGEQNH